MSEWKPRENAQPIGIERPARPFWQAALVWVAGMAVGMIAIGLIVNGLLVTT